MKNFFLASYEALSACIHTTEHGDTKNKELEMNGIYGIETVLLKTQMEWQRKFPGDFNVSNGANG